MKIDGPDLSTKDVLQALISPTAVFDTPREVLGSRVLSHTDKLKILKRWELDARALQRASDESMGGGESPPLDAINEALSQLDPNSTTPDNFGKVGTKI